MKSYSSKAAGQSGIQFTSNSHPCLHTIVSLYYILLVTILFVLTPSKAEDIQFPPDAFGIAPSPYGAWAMVNVKSSPYNAVGNGTADDTAAIQSAINAVGFGIVYLPAGTYRITAPLVWTVNGQDVPNRSLQGQGIDKTFIKLDDGATGFANPSSPQAVIQTRGEWWETNQAETATAFNNSLYSLTLNTGSKNAGAVGVSWMVSNQGSMRSVAIVSGDGQGVAGVNYLGESGGLMENVTITGFQYGIQGANGGYATLTADGLNLSGQTVAGLRPYNDVFFIGDLTSNSNAPALLTETSASRAVLDTATIHGGNSSEGAITYGGGNLFLRNIVTSSSSYGVSLNYTSNVGNDLSTVSGIAEWSSNAINTLFPVYSKGVSLNLQRAAVDPGFHTNDFTQWANVAAYYQSGDGSDWSLAFQRAIDSGAQIVYFPPSASNYTLGETVHIRDNVRKITGLRSANLSRLSGYSTPSMEFDNNNNGGASVVIEQFRSWSDIVINTTSPVVIRDMSTPTETGVIRNSAGVAANVTIDGLTGYAAFTSNTWATIRALNPEYPSAGTACISNNASTISLLGAKNEGVANLCDNEAGGKSDLLGYYSSPFATPQSSDIAFINNASSLFTFAFSRFGTPSYSTWVQETQNGTTLTGSQASLTPGYVGYLPTTSLVGQTIALQSVANNLFVCADNAGSSPLIANRGTYGQWEEYLVVDAGGGNISLQSLSNNKYVCADNSGSSPLIANRTTNGSWETFTVSNLSATTIALRSLANGLYVSAENNGNNPLIADHSSITTTEEFKVVVVPTTLVGHTIALQSLANNLFVCADNAGVSPLIANRGSYGQWEEYNVVDAGNGYVGLQSLANNMYVCADNAGGSPLIANRTAVGAWETFIVKTLSSSSIALQALDNGMYVTAENNGASPLIADHTTVTAAQTYNVIIVK